MTEFDLVIRGGTVIDGTGAPRRTADVAVADGLVVEVGAVSGEGRREIDADGALVAPGFVDIHTHYDGQAAWDSRMAPSSWHGVTTAVFGNCGVGFAPVHDTDHNRLIELMEGVEDIPGAALSEGLPWTWNSLPEYLDAIDTPKDIDIAAQVPHGALRLHVMGERGAAREDATADDIAQMAELAAEGVRAGALGFTTSRTTNHRTSTGEFTPTLTAATDELVGIAEAIGTTGTGVLQMVADFKDIPAEFAIARAMAQGSGRPLSFTLIESPRGWGYHQELLAEIERARADGLQITGQCAVRPIGVLLGFGCTLNPFMAKPAWREVEHLTGTELVAALNEPDRRRRLLESVTDPNGELVGGRLIEKYSIMYELGEVPNYEPPADQTLTARAATLGITAAELALDILSGPDASGTSGSGMLWVPFSNYGQGNLDGTRELLVHPFTVPGLSDGGAHVGTICDGSFPTTLLQHWGRDRSHDRIELEFLIQRQSRDTARTVGLYDRGVIAPGWRADLNVIDFDNIAVHRPEMFHDLPAGGRRIMQRADGYLHTLVRGIETYTSGTPTDELPGRLIRGAQAAPTGL